MIMFGKDCCYQKWTCNLILFLIWEINPFKTILHTLLRPPQTVSCLEPYCLYTMIVDKISLVSFYAGCSLKMLGSECPFENDHFVNSFFRESL